MFNGPTICIEIDNQWFSKTYIWYFDFHPWCYQFKQSILGGIKLCKCNNLKNYITQLYNSLKIPHTSAIRLHPTIFGFIQVLYNCKQNLIKQLTIMFILSIKRNSFEHSQHSQSLTSNLQVARLGKVELQLKQQLQPTSTRAQARAMKFSPKCTNSQACQSD